jgi:predicted transcriptional regulator
LEGAAQKAASRPAIAIAASVMPGYIVCLEDGRKLKSLKRHLRARYNLSPEQYRAKWGLPGNYPMVAPDYSKKRSMLAKTLGFGRKRKSYLAPAGAGR